MALLRRPRLRDRRQTITLEVESECCRLWLPPVDDPLFVPDFSEAVALAVAMLDAPVEREALVLLDERQRVVAIVFDPCDVVGLAPGALAATGLVDDFCRTLVITPQLHIAMEPTLDEVAAYDSLRRRHALQGIELIDMLLTDTDSTRSMAIALHDRDCTWFAHDPVEGSDAETDAGLAA